MGPHVDCGLPGGQGEEGKMINFETLQCSSKKHKETPLLRGNVGIAGTGAGGKFPWRMAKYRERFCSGRR